MKWPYDDETWRDMAAGIAAWILVPALFWGWVLWEIVK